MKKIITTLILFCFISISLSDEIQKIPFKKQNDPTVPLYENSSPFWQDYRVNQTIKQSIRWASAGVGVGIVSYLASDQDSEGDTILSILLAGGLGIAGCVGGGISGYFDGVKYNNTKQSNSSFHTNKYSIGQEFEYSYTSFLGNGITSRDTPKYSLTFQTFHKHRFAPSEYRVSISGASIGFLNNNFGIEPRTLSLDILFNSNKNYFQFHYGFGAGYSRGYLTDEYYSITTGQKVSGILFYPLAGVTINFMDFFYGRIEGRYELSQFYYNLSDYYDGEPQTGAFNIGFSFGTYLF